MEVPEELPISKPQFKDIPSCETMEVPRPCTERKAPYDMKNAPGPSTGRKAPNQMRNTPGPSTGRKAPYEIKNNINAGSSPTHIVIGAGTSGSNL